MIVAEKKPLEAVARMLESCDRVLAVGCGTCVTVCFSGGAKEVATLAASLRMKRRMQTLAERFPNARVLPALNTLFMGLPTEQGVWEERCQGCGNCVLDKTGGICPVSRCAKQLFNGPCGGSQNGVCEVDPMVPCAWHSSRDGGVRRMVREDLRAPREEKKEG